MRTVGPMSVGSGAVMRTWSRAGFTLLEMLVVVLIIGVLASMIVPRLLPQAEDAKIKIAQAEIEANVPVALDLFFLNVGRFPTTEEGLEALWTCPASVDKGTWRGPYLKKREALDPWGHALAYRQPSQLEGLNYDLACCGPDGIEGTNDDITNVADR